MQLLNAHQLSVDYQLLSAQERCDDPVKKVEGAVQEIPIHRNRMRFTTITQVNLWLRDVKLRRSYLASREHFNELNAAEWSTQAWNGTWERGVSIINIKANSSAFLPFEQLVAVVTSWIDFESKLLLEIKEQQTSSKFKAKKRYDLFWKNFQFSD